MDSRVLPAGEELECRQACSPAALQLGLSGFPYHFLPAGSRAGSTGTGAAPLTGFHPN